LFFSGEETAVSQVRGIVFGLLAAIIGLGGVGYAYYIKQVDYAPVDGRITGVSKICYRLLKNSKEPIRDTSVFLPKQEHPCPNVHVGFNQHRDTAHRIARFTLIDVSYVSPADGQIHSASVRKEENASHNQLTIGQMIEVRAHKRIANDILVDLFP
jgi:hypothetical protein